MSKPLTLAEVLNKFERDHRDLTSAQVNLLTVRLRQAVALLQQARWEDSHTGDKLEGQAWDVIEAVTAAEEEHSPLAVSTAGDWGFWDETWSNWHGGYGSRFEANQALRRYAAQL